MASLDKRREMKMQSAQVALLLRMLSDDLKTQSQAELFDKWHDETHRHKTQEEKQDCNADVISRNTVFTEFFNKYRHERESKPLNK